MHYSPAAQVYPSYEDAVADGWNYDGVPHLNGLGGFEENLKRVFAAIPGAGNAYNDLVLLIQSKAKQGAEQAIPTIEAAVEKKVTPYVIAAGLLGLGGFLFGLSTYLQYRRA